jgi:fructokinase
MTHSVPTVVALGEVLWDLFPDGARFGGAPANFAHHAASLGADVWLVTGLGDDELGREARERLNQSGLQLDYVAIFQDYPTGRVEIKLNEQGEASYQFGNDEAWDHLQWSEGLAGLSVRCDAVCFGTLGQRHEDSRRVIQRFVSSTPADCFRVLDLNLRPPHSHLEVIEASLALANVLKLNGSELKFLADLLSLDGSDPESRLRELAERFEFRAVALTLGENGALLFREGSCCRVDSQPVQLEDTVGAGDSFTAVVTAGLVAGADLSEIARWACRVAEFVCSRKGATPRLPPELLPPFLKK